jgi:hypothetical protein
MGTRKGHTRKGHTRKKPKPKKKARPKSRHKLVTSGGQGCIFEPAIRCKGKSATRPSRRKTSSKTRKIISKVMFHEKSAKREFQMNDRVREIPGHEDWAILWDTLCDTPEYRKISKTSDIQTCLQKKHLKPTPQQSYPMLVGPFGGDTLNSYSLGIWTKTALQTQTAFDKALGTLWNLLENMFFALTQLQGDDPMLHVAHADITVRNVLVKDSQTYLIDFGLAYLLSNTGYVKSHLEFLFQGTDRIYEAYPYDYYLYHGHQDTEALVKELQEVEKGDFREYHEEYRRVHELILGEQDVDRTLVDFMESLLHTKPDVTLLMKSLDVYSVGMLLPTLLYDACQEHQVPWSDLQTFCLQSAHREKLRLLREMTCFSSQDRLTPSEAYTRYQELQS